jgi:hypothetical protein
MEICDPDSEQGILELWVFYNCKGTITIFKETVISGVHITKTYKRISILGQDNISINTSWFVAGFEKKPYRNKQECLSYTAPLHVSEPEIVIYGEP